MVTKCVCTHHDKEQAENAADALEKAGCEVEVKRIDKNIWGVWSDGKLSTRTVMEKF
jgi:hypothetical protein